jgi:phosphohistidine phosphatase
VRHAKSSWNNDDLEDFHRPLNNRGFKVAPEMGQRFAEKKCKLDAIISRPATRAITTAQIIAQKKGFNIDDAVVVGIRGIKNGFNIDQITSNIEIYEATLDVLMDLIHQVNDQFGSIMLVGHNPGFTELVNYLVYASIDNMPTCAIAQIQLDVDSWKEISKHSGELISFDYPKLIH